jgi:aminoglycoside phosphotransferase family enzyme
MSAQQTDAAVQDEVAAFLADPRTHGGRVARVKRIDTHAAMVFLAGDDVYKVKRAVRFPFLDFSTLERRRRACEREVELNRASAPDLYLGVVPITRSPDGRLSFGGRGPVVEWAVHMRRFDETATFDRLAAAGRIDAAMVDALAVRVAALHADAAAAEAAAIAGRMSRIAAENIGELRERPDLFTPLEVDRLAASTDMALARLAPLMQRRASAGHVRRCHGDLHLANIALIDGRPVLFDALEFDEDLATIDVFYDLAFLVMDLWSRGGTGHANRLLNRWLALRRMTADDLDGLALLPLFVSMRAAPRSGRRGCAISRARS